MNGFTYNGVHSSKYNVYYIPDPAAKWWKESEYETYKKDVAWKHGGYWFGATANIREITLACYFEEIDNATREKIRRWLGRTTSGNLIFDDTPFIYYKVRPANVVPGKLYLDTDESKSGTFTITFMAVDPFGYLTRKANTGTETDNAKDYCGIITQGRMPSAPTTSNRTFRVYNPGTEECGLSIKLSGTAGKKIRFISDRNGTQCIINSLPTGGLILDIDGDNGFVKTYVNGSPDTYDNGFAYHDRGFIRLESDETYEDLPYTAVVDGDTCELTLTNMKVNQNMIGGFIRFGYPYTKGADINRVDEENNKLICGLNGTGDVPTGSNILFLSTHNRIRIQELSANNNWVTPTSLSLSTIAVDYQPRLL